MSSPAVSLRASKPFPLSINSLMLFQKDEFSLTTNHSHPTHIHRHTITVLVFLQASNITFST